MEENEKMNNREELFSRPVRAGKRTYFFDVKATRGDEKYITITESKRRFSNEQNRFFYEKHKIFLYKEDFEKFMNALKDTFNYIETGEYPEGYFDEPARAATSTSRKTLTTGSARLRASNDIVLQIKRIPAMARESFFYGS